MKIEQKLLTYLFLILLSNGMSAQTNGIFVPQMSTCDNLVQNFMSTHSIPGATFALAKDGKLVYMRSFGNANIAETEVTQPYHLFRIASLSKPITSIAIMKLLENGQLNLNDKVFGAGGILQNDAYFSNANITDNRIYNITVANLLEHAAGWNRDINCFPNPTSPYPWQFNGCDPIAAPLHVTQVLGEGNLASEKAMIKFLLEKGLEFTPGTGYAYSNIGYLMLGEIIASVSGMSYENYVKTAIFEPLGICDIHLGKNLLADKYEREGEYIGNGFTTLSSYGTGIFVPWEYGGFNIEAMDAHGGWVATARDLVRLLVAVDGFPTKPDILSNATLSIMTTPSSNNSFYSKGWSVNSANNWWHTGALDGTASFMARSNNGYTWAIILNKRVIGDQANQFWSDFDNLPWNCISTTSSYPTHDFLEAPTTNCSNLTFETSTTPNSIKINWSNGNGGNRVLVARKNSPVVDFPRDGIDYSANSQFGSGPNIGNTSYIVYNGSGNTATISGLEANSTYHFRLFEYSKSNSTGNYSLYMLCNSPQRSHLTSCLTTLDLPNTVSSSGTFSAGNIITSKAILNSGSFTYQAGTSITLNEGFHAQLGSEFLAKIQACTFSSLQEEGDNNNSKQTTLVEMYQAALKENNPIPVNNELSIKVFPNPSKEQINIDYQLDESGYIDIKLIDLTGKIVKVIVPNRYEMKGNYQISHNLTYLENGMYFVHLSSNSGIEICKFSLFK